MVARCRKKDEHKPRVLRAAFTLVELLMSIALLALVMAGIIYGYAQANRIAEWNAMSLAAQSYALQGLEQVRSAKWDLWANPIIDVIPAPTNFTQSDTMDIPVSGAPYYVTNYIKLIQISTSPQLREVWSQCVWVFPTTKKVFTNTVITYRAPDHQ